MTGNGTMQTWSARLSKGAAAVTRLRGRSLDECWVRGGQEIRKYAERVLGIDQDELSDRAFGRMLRRTWSGHAPEAVVRQVLTRLQAAPFMPGLADRQTAVRLMQGRFEAELADVLERADRAMQGRFDLLGFRDLCFGDPVDWRLEPMSGKRTPLDHWSRIPYLDGHTVGDKKIVWELNRHAHFVTLGQAYWVTQNERYADAFVRQASSWMDANPPRRGINWASSLEVSFRSIAWLWALHLFAGSDRLTAPFVWRLLKALAQHGDYLQSYLSHYFSPNTHLTGEALGLFYMGTTLSELRSAEDWRDLGLRVLLDQLPKQVRRDGVYFEQASYYHRYTADFYLHLIWRAKSAGIALPSWVDHHVCAMLDHIMWITRPDGVATLYGDDDGGRLISLGERAPDDFRDTLALGAVLYERSDWKWVAGAPPSELLWIAGAEAVRKFDALDAKPPRDSWRLFEASGYAVLRDGWDRQAAYLFIDCGPHGSLRSGHAHDDALSFEYAADGVAWIVDPGTYTYTGDAMERNRFRTAIGHNTITVDGLSHSIPAGPFSWSRTTDARLVGRRSEPGSIVIEGTHDGYLRLDAPVRHWRSVTFAPRSDRPHAASSAVITDRLASDGAHRYELRFHLGVGCEAALDEPAARVSHPSGRQVLIALWRILADGVAVPLLLHLERAWASRCYGSRRQIEVLTGVVQAGGAHTLVTFIVPIHAGEVVQWDRWLAAHAATAGRPPLAVPV